MLALPPAVHRYFDSVLPDGQQMIRAARLKQRGKFLRSGSARWEPFEAQEVFITDPVSYEWDARIRIAPFVTAHVRDAYCAGRGSIAASVFGIVKLANEHDRPELDSAALQRYLAEAIWFPTALLPNGNLTWTGLDSSRALARISDARTTTSLEFTFARAGEVSEIYTPHRYRTENGRYEKTPWGAVCQRYESVGGILIPTKCEAYWKIDDQVLPYWIGEVVDVDYDCDEAKPLFHSSWMQTRAA